MSTISVPGALTINPSLEPDSFPTEAPPHEAREAALPGRYVQVIRGCATGAAGWVLRCTGNRITFLDTHLSSQPILLTVDAAVCQSSSVRLQGDGRDGGECKDAVPYHRPSNGTP